jgi:hypothetical protein
MKSLIYFLLFSLHPLYCQSHGHTKLLLAPNKNPFVWSITYKYDDLILGSEQNSKKTIESDVAKQINHILPKKTNFVCNDLVSLRHVITLDESETSYYYFKGIQIHKDNIDKEIKSESLSTYSDDEQLFRVRFPGITWINQKFMKGVVDYKGEKCVYFIDDDVEIMDTDNNDPNIDITIFKKREAWFNAETGLPVAFKIGEMEGVYRFEDRPSPKVIVPQDIREKIKQCQSYLDYQRRRGEPGKPVSRSPRKPR